MTQKEIETTIYKGLVRIISETNGLALIDTLELLLHDPLIESSSILKSECQDFYSSLAEFHADKIEIQELLDHPVSRAFFRFFKKFPLPYYEEHIHLTGSLDAEFLFPRIQQLLEGPNKDIYEERIKRVYGEDALPIKNLRDIDNLIRLKDGEQFKTYLKILYLAKLVLTDKKAHEDAAFHMASTLYHEYNVGSIRLKFTLNRSTSNPEEQIPGVNDISSEDVVLGLYDGFMKFKKEYPGFNFILSPSFRKEGDFFDNKRFPSKAAHFNAQVEELLGLLNKHTFLKEYVLEVDTVGDEKDLHRKAHFVEMKWGLRRLHYRGLKIRSHHGETWKNLRKGVQSVDNAMNIWHIDTLEHGLSLGINPNFYFHSLFQRVLATNLKGVPIEKNSKEYNELMDMEWQDPPVKDKILQGVPLNKDEITIFVKTKFHTAREVEHYQHDVLNRMIDKQVGLVALPSSNMKLTGCFPDYKDHPFSWWEKKGVHLGVGTDNYVTLNTNYINEMLILLYSDPENLKITKLLMITTREGRRPYISSLLWEMRKRLT